MTLSMPLSTFTDIHTIVSLVAIAAGVIVVIGLLRSRRLRLWSALYLLAAVATSATGFGFPYQSFGPSHWVGVVSLAALAVAVLARYLFHLGGLARGLYAVGVTVSLFFLFFVLVAQGFAKVAFLKALAPTQSEPPFAVAEGVLLLAFVGLAVLAVKRFHPRSGFSARG